MMKKRIICFPALFFLVCITSCQIRQQRDVPDRIDLAGNWSVALDRDDRGIEESWYGSSLSGSTAYLPGSLVQNGLGNDISVNTRWTGSIMDSSWYHDDEYAPYRQPGTIKIPFWLQPDKHYIGAAWYQKKIKIPAHWKGKRLRLFLERCHWQTQLWLDDDYQGMRNSLSTPHIYDLESLSSATHRLTLCVDNRLKIQVGKNAHSVSDHTQGNWNGVVGDLYLQAMDAVRIADVQVYPDVDDKTISIYIDLTNQTSQPASGRLQIEAVTINADPVHWVPALQKDLTINAGKSEYRLEYDMQEKAYLWDEFSPVVYRLQLDLKGETFDSRRTIEFGMRRFQADGRHFSINGRKTFLRGTLECAIFPQSGYPAMQRGDWMRIFHICKEHGLNHMRFHSWCPPEAAFEAADRSGVYLQVECAIWPNQGATLGDGDPVDAFLYDESERIVHTYGNHPSFCLLASGNEPAGESVSGFLRQWVTTWQARDDRRLYTSASAWPILSASDFHVTPEPRIQQWGAGLGSAINSRPPQTDFDYAELISEWQKPVISHETGQWCVYPDFSEIDRYRGVLKAKNLQIFQKTLQKNQLGDLATAFLHASGKLQTLCYKADIEALLRTPGMGGFQLLQLHDFPGQGTALVGILNPFWRQKGYVLPAQCRRFCNQTVPLAAMAKRVFHNRDTLRVRCSVTHFGPHPLLNLKPHWRLQTAAGDSVAHGVFAQQDIAIGNNIALGRIAVSLDRVQRPQRLNLELFVGEYANDWNVWVFPQYEPVQVPEYILVTPQLDLNAERALQQGNNVLLTLPPAAVASDKGGDIAVGFSTVFWNTAWTNNQAPHTLGLLCNPAHAAWRHFPTRSHSDWQWWEPLYHAQAVVLDHTEPRPDVILRLIDDWFSNRSLALIAEMQVGKGKLILCGIDLNGNLKQRMVSQQLKRSLVRYMSSQAFQPRIELSIDQIRALYR